MMSIPDLPTVNALLNLFSSVLAGLGYWQIRRRNVRAHRLLMIGAVLASAGFLASYLTYHYYSGSTRFQGQGWARTVYFTILISHSVLAAAVVPLVPITLFRALRGRYASHRALARWTLPVWLYVSVTGVAVYLFLYH